MDDPRIIELLTEMVHEQKQTNARLDRLEVRIEHLEEHQQTTNLKLQELTLSNVRLPMNFTSSVNTGNELCASNPPSFTNVP